MPRGQVHKRQGLAPVPLHRQKCYLILLRKCFHKRRMTTPTPHLGSALKTPVKLELLAGISTKYAAVDVISVIIIIVINCIGPTVYAINLSCFPCPWRKGPSCLGVGLSGIALSIVSQQGGRQSTQERTQKVSALDPFIARHVCILKMPGFFHSANTWLPLVD